MKTKTTNIGSLTVEYPSLAFAFNPTPIKITRAQGTSIPYSISLVGNGVTLDRYLTDLQTSIVVDIQMICKSLFNRSDLHKVEKIDNSLFKKLDLVIKIGSESKTISIPTLWGALQMGEEYEQNTNIPAFPNYPFTVSVYSEDAVEIQLDNGTISEVVGTSDTMTKLNIDLTNQLSKIGITSDDFTITSYQIVYRDVFDKTFDRTFQNIKLRFKTDLLITVDIEKCVRDGLYFRWINKLGNYCYYLFDRGKTTTEIEDSETKIQGNYNSVGYVDNYNVGTGGAITKNIQQEIDIFASFVDSETLELLQGFAQSPFVDLFQGYDENKKPLWMRYNVKDGDFIQTSAILQEFTATVLLPTTFIQSL